MDQGSKMRSIDGQRIVFVEKPGDRGQSMKPKIPAWLADEDHKGIWLHSSKCGHTLRWS